MDITVVICTHNGAPHLPNVLDRLATQVCMAAINWEIVIVDNNSNDQTVWVVQLYQALPAFADKLQYVFEPKQGLAFARRCAVQVAKGDLLAFLDDDNLPNPHWVQAVYNFGQKHPDAGAYGSQIVGRCEIEPPPDFERIACFLAVIDRCNLPFRYDQLNRWLFPAGAGLVVRRQAWLANVPEQPALSGVAAQDLTGKGEDIETLSYLRKAGWPIWHNPGMRIEHVIARDRLSAHYLLALFRGVGLSRYHTRMIRFRHWQRPFATMAYCLNDLRRLIFHYLKYSRAESSVVVWCELTLLYYSMLSPFYGLYQKIVRVVNQSSFMSSSIVQIDSS